MPTAASAMLDGFWPSGRSGTPRGAMQYSGNSSRGLNLISARMHSSHGRQMFHAAIPALNQISRR